MAQEFLCVCVCVCVCVCACACVCVSACMRARVFVRVVGAGEQITLGFDEQRDCPQNKACVKAWCLSPSLFILRLVESKMILQASSFLFFFPLSFSFFSSLSCKKIFCL